jgi:hypothetical protein
MHEGCAADVCIGVRFSEKTWRTKDRGKKDRRATVFSGANPRIVPASLSVNSRVLSSLPKSLPDPICLLLLTDRPTSLTTPLLSLNLTSSNPHPRTLAPASSNGRLALFETRDPTQRHPRFDSAHAGCPVFASTATTSTVQSTYIHLRRTNTCPSCCLLAICTTPPASDPTPSLPAFTNQLDPAADHRDSAILTRQHT